VNKSGFLTFLSMYSFGTIIRINGVSACISNFFLFHISHISQGQVKSNALKFTNIYSYAVLCLPNVRRN